MTEHEKQTILNSIQSYRNMIEYFQEQINILNSKLEEKCCFDEIKKEKIPIRNKQDAKEAKRHTSKR